MRKSTMALATSSYLQSLTCNPNVNEELGKENVTLHVHIGFFYYHTNVLAFWY